MTKRTTTTLGTVVVTIVLAALAAPAYASENGKGDEHANAHAAAQSAQASANGNAAEQPNVEAAAQSASASGSPSATAPGQAKKAEQAQPRDVKSSSSNASQQSKANGSSKSTPSTAGVKPSSSTSHNVSAPAASNATKLYGNGQTAGQIAIHNGASGNAVLYGPGNSQPHKTAACGQITHGNGGGFDVHALKSHSKKNRCGDDPTTVTVPKDPAMSTSAPGRGVSPSSGQPAASPATSHGVMGAAADEGAESGVLGALQAVDAATLPFTGVALWSIAIVGLALVGVGLTLRRQAFAAV